MKTTVFVVSLLLLSSVSGCYSDHNDSRSTYGLEGHWNLTHIGGGISGMDISIDPGIIIWTFDEHNGIVTIVNNSENDYSFPSGTYDYQIEPNGEYISITINGVTYGSIVISDTQVQIDQKVADGVLLELTKINFEHL